MNTKTTKHNLKILTNSSPNPPPKKKQNITRRPKALYD